MERLPAHDWSTAPSVRAVIDALEAAGGKGCARFVGGCVRDTLLGRGDEVTDVDIATQLLPDQVIAALKAAGLKAVPTGIEHGTITAVSDHKPYEITTLRRDVETDGRRAVVAFTTDWAEDAQRRDFRLNALYADPDGAIHDPTGGGLEDVAARRITFVGDPEQRIREDYLRILRFFRFLARVGDAAQADGAGLAACEKLKDGIAGLSGERIRQEMFKLLASPDPLPAVRLMAETAVLAAALPWTEFDLQRLARLVQADRALSLPADALLRLAALVRFDGLRDVGRRLRLSNADKLRLSIFEQIAPDEAEDDHLEVLQYATSQRQQGIYTYGAAALKERMRLAWAAAADARLSRLSRQLEQLEGWSPPPFPVTGEEIKALGVPEGPRVGEVRRALEKWWIDGDFTATKAQALAELERLAPTFRGPSL